MKKVDTKKLALALFELTENKSESEAKKVVADFAEYLAKNRLLNETEKIISEYIHLYNQKHSILEAEVVLVNRLPETIKSEIKKSLKQKFNSQEVNLLEKVDQRVIGGLKIKIGDIVYDDTLANSLKKLNQKLSA